jgi:hypothetical protein
LTAYENITKGLNPDQVQTFTEYMTDINWNDAEAVETFGEQLKLMGLNIPESEIENFINLMKEAGNAFDKLDLEKITEQATSLQKMVRDINEGEQDRTFSAENF